jgi:hypothetical protein
MAIDHENIQRRKQRRALWALVKLIGIPSLIIIALLFAIKGPAGTTNMFRSWFASSYGSDWYVVQYAQSGCILADWNLRDRAIDNEANSDGIYFISRGESVVHLSGHYDYIQNPTKADIESLRGLGYCADLDPCVGGLVR